MNENITGATVPREAVGAYRSAFFLWLFLGIFWIGFNLLTTPDFNIFQTFVLAMVAGLFLVIWLACRRQGEKLPFVLYSAVYVVFHFGMTLLALLQPTTLLEQRSWARWYFSGFFVEEAYNVAIVFFFGLCAAALVSYRRRAPSQPAAKSGEQIRVSSREVDRFFICSLGAACLAWAFIVLIVLGVSDYSQYNEEARGASSGIAVEALTFIYPIIGALLFYGLLLSNKKFVVLTVFGIWSAVAFPLGLRGEVLFPLVMALPILVIHQRIRFRPVIFVALVLAALLASSFVRTYRNDSSFESAAENTSVLMGLAELGGSLRPAYEVRRWIETGMDDFRWGETFYAPFERTLQGVIPFYERLPAREDMRLMNVAIVEYTGGNYGFSIAAESYINFGFPGALGVGFLSGLLMLRFGQGMAMSRIEIAVPALAFALLYHIRQSFVGAYASFVIFAVCAILIVGLVKSLEARRSRVQSR